jgi:hypothetical protein
MIWRPYGKGMAVLMMSTPESGATEGNAQGAEMPCP